MKTFQQINNAAYTIEETDPNNSMLIVDGKRCSGSTHFVPQEIYIASGLKDDLMYRTICHELAHAFLYETQISNPDSYTEEELCEFIGKYAKKICDIADSYISTRSTLIK